MNQCPAMHNRFEWIGILSCFQFCFEFISRKLWNWRIDLWLFTSRPHAWVSHDLRLFGFIYKKKQHEWWIESIVYSIDDFQIGWKVWGLATIELWQFNRLSQTLCYENRIPKIIDWVCFWIPMILIMSNGIYFSAILRVFQQYSRLIRISIFSIQQFIKNNCSSLGEIL